MSSSTVPAVPSDGGDKRPDPTQEQVLETMNAAGVLTLGSRDLPIVNEKLAMLGIKPLMLTKSISMKKMMKMSPHDFSQLAGQVVATQERVATAALNTEMVKEMSSDHAGTVQGMSKDSVAIVKTMTNGNAEISRELHARISFLEDRLRETEVENAEFRAQAQFSKLILHGKEVSSQDHIQEWSAEVLEPMMAELDEYRTRFGTKQPKHCPGCNQKWWSKQSHHKTCWTCSAKTPGKGK